MSSTDSGAAYEPANGGRPREKTRGVVAHVSPYQHYSAAFHSHHLLDDNDHDNDDAGGGGGATAPALRPPRRRHWASTWWLWELTSMLLSLACVVAVVVLLARIQGRPLARWTFFVSPNAVLAIFVTAAKSTALVSIASCLSQAKWHHFYRRPRPLRHLDLFDDASRGPLGAVHLLARAPWSAVSVLGALVTVLALGVDTFAQQVVGLETRDVEVAGGNATLGLSRAYVIAHTDQAGGAFPWSARVSTLDTAMQGAIFQGIYSLPSQPSFNCSSNCTWPASYLTLGFAADCTDVTAAAVASRRCVDSGSRNGGLNCTLTTPANVSFDTLLVPTDYQTVVVVKAEMLPTDAVVADATFARFGILRLPDVFSNQTVAAWPDDGHEAYDCALRVDAHRYGDVSASGSSLAVGRSEVVPLRRGILNEHGHLVYNRTNLGDAARGETLVVSLYDLYALASFFQSASFSGRSFTGESYPSEPMGMARALETGWVASSFAAMARSMTDRLRSERNTTTLQDTNPDPAVRPDANAAATGLVRAQVVFVTVDWRWLALPFAVEAAAALLLLLTVVQNRRASGVRLWKASVVAALYHRVDAADGVCRGEVGSPEELAELARSVRVRIVS